MSSSQISEVVRSRIREQAKNRCGYCQSHQRYVLGPLEIEHIVPKAAGGSDEEENLWLACRLCNNYKGTQIQAIDPVTQRIVKLFDPRRQQLSQHFIWSKDGVYICGLTAIGRVTVLALQLNNAYAITVRQAWVSVGWHSPAEN